MRYLYFGSVRGDLQEGHDYASRCQSPLFPSTKSEFLCAFGVWNPCFRAFRAQNRGFCVRMGDFPPVFGTPEHKIGIFVLELPESWPGGGKCGLGEEKSAQVLGLRAFTNLSCCSECRSTRSAILLGVPPHHLLARKRRAGERRARKRRAWARMAVGFTGGRG